jgi:tripartite-type tricarboxylate transporter receptor subunit TctC
MELIMDRRQVISSLGAGLASFGLPGQALSQTFGAKQTRFVVAFPAGGVVDFAARTVAEGLQSSGSSVLVENKAGAGGNIAMEYVAKQAADSSNFGVFANSIFSTNPMVPQLASKSADALKDLVPVAAVADMILVLAVSSQLGVNNLEQFLAKAKAPGQRLRIGLAGVGTPHHLAALLLERSTGIDATMVPYKGGAPMIIDAAGGHVDAVFTTIPVGGPMVAAGKLKWIAIAQPTTVKSLPGIPSLVNVYKGASIPSWIGVWAPSNTPPEVLNAMNASINATVNSAAIANKLVGNGLEPLNLSRAEAATRMNEEVKFMKDFLSKVKLDFQA